MTAQEKATQLHILCGRVSDIRQDLVQLNREVHRLDPSGEIKFACGRADSATGHLVERLYTWLDAAEVEALTERNQSDDT